MRNKRLDVLRCVAILLVLFLHTGIFEIFYYNGRIGVDLFFVLSGFLISGLLVFTFFLELAHHHVAHCTTISLASSSLQSYRDGIWLHTWSLAFKEHFYIFLPLLLLLLLPLSRNRTDPFRSIPGIFLVIAVLCQASRALTAMAFSTADYGIATTPDSP